MTDGNALLTAWAGHWRGTNATQETVICDISFETRLSLEAVCGLGYTVAESPLNAYWATDLLHRVFHLPKIAEGVLDHFSEDYAGVLKLARTEPEKSAIDTDALQYFAIDAYAFDIAAPGVGCTGQLPEEEEEEEDQATSATSVPAGSPTDSSSPVSVDIWTLRFHEKKKQK